MYSEIFSYVHLRTGGRVGLDCNGQFVIVAADVGMPTRIRRLLFEVVLQRQQKVARFVATRNDPATSDAVPTSRSMRMSCHSGDLDGVLEAGRDLLGERNNEVTVERLSDTGEGIEPVLCAAAFFES